MRHEQVVLFILKIHVGQFGVQFIYDNGDMVINAGGVISINNYLTLPQPILSVNFIACKIQQSIGIMMPMVDLCGQDTMLDLQGQHYLPSLKIMHHSS